MDNLAVDGGGLGASLGFNDTVTLIDCRIANNEATNSGGGLSVAGVGSISISDCQIVDNLADDIGGGARFEVASVTVDSSLFQTNTLGPTGVFGGGAFFGQLSGQGFQTAAVTNTIFDGNGASIGGAAQCYDGDYEFSSTAATVSCSGPVMVWSGLAVGRMPFASSKRRRTRARNREVLVLVACSALRP